MVKGLQRFMDHFKGFENSYVLIGGAACDVWLTDRELPFRVTKDLDLVLIVEAMEPVFVERFWTFIRTGRYRSHQRSDIRPLFYRFKAPEGDEYPFMIELLSRNHLDLPPGVHLTPIPVDEDISSLSAILLEDAYYHFVIETRTVVNGVPIIPAQCLIPLKARAWLDLTARKAAGDANVKGDDIRKHRNDLFRLYRSVASTDRFTLPDRLRDDLHAFLGNFPPESSDWPAIFDAVGAPELPDPTAIIGQLRASFHLSAEAAQ
jgi:hypothetical protein